MIDPEMEGFNSYQHDQPFVVPHFGAWESSIPRSEDLKENHLGQRAKRQKAAEQRKSGLKATKTPRYVRDCHRDAKCQEIGFDLWVVGRSRGHSDTDQFPVAMSWSTLNHSLHRLNKDQILNVPFTNLTDLVTSTSPSNGQQTLIIVIFIFITSKFFRFSWAFPHVCPTFFRTSFRCRRDLRSFRVHRELLLSQLRSDSEASADFTIDLGEVRWGFLTFGTFGILWEHIWEQIWKTSGESSQIFSFPKLYDVFYFGKHIGKHIGKLNGKHVWWHFWENIL